MTATIPLIELIIGEEIFIWGRESIATTKAKIPTINVTSDVKLSDLKNLLRRFIIFGMSEIIIIPNAKNIIQRIIWIFSDAMLIVRYGLQLSGICIWHWEETLKKKKKGSKRGNVR